MTTPRPPSPIAPPVRLTILPLPILDPHHARHLAAHDVTRGGLNYQPHRRRLVAVLWWHRAGASEWCTCGVLEFGAVAAREADTRNADTRVDPDTINERTRRELEQMVTVQVLARLAEAAVERAISRAEAAEALFARLNEDAAPLLGETSNDRHALAAMLADLALPEAAAVDPGGRRPQRPGTRRLSADPSRYGVDVLAAWVCRHPDGSAEVVRRHADGAWSTSNPDPLDAPDRARRGVAAESLELVAARTVGEVRDALLPLRLAHRRARVDAAVDRALAAVTALLAAVEREDALADDGAPLEAERA